MRKVWRTTRRFLGAIPPVPPQALAAFHISVGAAILAGGRERFSGPSYAGARQLSAVVGVPYGCAWLTWGSLLATVGVVVLFTWPWIELKHARVATCAVLFGAAPMLFFTLGFVASLRLSEVASSSGIGAYGILALFHIHTAVKMIRHGSWDQRRPDGAWERRSQNVWMHR